MQIDKARAIAEKIKELLPNIERRFWPRVLKSDDEDGCWLWTGAKVSDGYGSIKVGRHSTPAHRVAYIIQVGDIPLGLSVLHSCDNPPCVRGSHLFLGYQADNVRDMLIKGRGNKATGDNNGSRLHPERRPRGDRHPFALRPELRARGERVNNAKLKAAQVNYIRAQRRQGVSPSVLAHQFGVHLRNIQTIVSGKTWRHLL